MLKNNALKFTAAVICSGVLVLAGCASSENDQTDASPSPSSPQATVTQTQTVTETPPAQTASVPDDSDDDSAPGEQPGAGFPTNAVDYADALVVAWGNGDRPTMQDLAQPAVIDALEDYSMPGGPNWQQTDSNAGAGSTFITYENSQDGTIVELRIRNHDASSGEPNAIVEAKFTE